MKRERKDESPELWGVRRSIDEWQRSWVTGTQCHKCVLCHIYTSSFESLFFKLGHALGRTMAR